MARHSVELGDELGERVKGEAERRYISLTAMVRTVLAEWLEELVKSEETIEI